MVKYLRRTRTHKNANQRPGSIFIKYLSFTKYFNLLGLSNESRAIVRGASWVAVFLLAAKGIAAAKEILIAQKFGTSSLIDGYLFSLNIVNWPVDVFYCVSASIFVPLFVRLQAQHSAEIEKFKSDLLSGCMLLGLLLAVAAYITLPLLIEADWANLNEVSRTAAHESVPFVIGMVPFGIVAGAYSAWLMSKKNHANTFLDGMPSLAIALLLVIWPKSTESELLRPVLWGTLLGFGLRTGCLALLTHGWKVTCPSFSFRHSRYWKEISGAMGYIVLAQFAMSNISLVDQFLLIRMQDGSLAAFGYANRIMLLVFGLSATALGRAMLPIFASLNDPGDGWNMAKRWIWRVFCLGGIVGAIVALLSEYIVKLLFEHGQFTSNDTVLVSRLLAILMLQLPFYLAGTVWMQWLLSKPGSEKVLLVAAIIAATTKSAAGLAFVLLFGWGSESVAITSFLSGLVYLLVLQFIHSKTQASLFKW